MAKVKRNVWERLEELVRSRLGISPPEGAIAAALEDVPAVRVDPEDKVEAVAAEVCAAACREGGVVLPHPDVATKLRELFEAHDRRTRVVLAALAAAGEPRKALPAAFKVRDALETLARAVLPAPPGRAFVPDHPIRLLDVCRECERTDPGLIQFGKRPADTGALKDQVDDVHGWVLRRLRELKIEARVETALCTRYGECRPADHDERGHGWFELPVILTRVDLGEGVVVEREYEVHGR